MRATTEGAEIPRSGNSLPRRAIALGYSPSTVRRLAQAPPTPFIDGRKSVASHARANMRATTEGAEILRSGNSLPRRASALGYAPSTVRRARASTADPVYRWSKIGRIDAPTPICVQRPRGPKS
jgi:hypothetical protein